MADDNKDWGSPAAKKAGDEANPWASATAPGAAPENGASAPPPPGPRASGRPAPAPRVTDFTPGIMQLRPQTFGDYLGVPFKALRFNTGVILGGPLLFTLLGLVAAIAFLYFIATDPVLTNPGAAAADYFSDELVISGIVAIVATTLADIYSAAVIAPGYRAGVLGEKIHLGVAFKEAVKRTWGLLAIALATGLMTLAVIAFVLIPVFSNPDDPASLGLAFLLFLLASPVALALIAYKVLATSALMLEKVGPLKALRRAGVLLFSRFWWAVLLGLVTFVIYWVFSMVMSTISQVMSLVAVGVGGENFVVTIILFFLLFGLTQVISYLPLYFFVYGALTTFYIDVRIRREGFDQDLLEVVEARASV